MKYLLLIHMNDAAWDTLTEEQRNEVFRGHEEFQRITKESGEYVDTAALAAPTNSVTVRVRDGATAATDGPFIETKEYLAGYYMVDCESLERAIELAALIPDAKFNAMEVRPVMHHGGAEI